MPHEGRMTGAFDPPASRPLRAAEAPPPRAATSIGQDAWRRFRRDRVGVVSGVVVIGFLLLVAAAAAGIVAGGWQQETGVPNAPPGIFGMPSSESTAAGAASTKAAERAHAAVPADPAGGANAAAAVAGTNVDLSSVDPLAPRYAEWAERTRRYAQEEPPRAATLPFGGDRLGRDVLEKAVKGTQVSVLVGVLAALCATTIGTLLGAFAGFFGRGVGDFLEWLYNVFTAIPEILLIFAFAAVSGRGIASVTAILALVGWTGVYRQVRAEFIKHSSRDYVRAAEAIGASPLARMFRHILPNVGHVILVRLSLLVVAFIKAEVILSYLGLGVAIDQVSWGTMLAEAQNDLILGHWWQLAAATAFMATFVTAFSLLTDALRDALDPKLRGLD